MENKSPELQVAIKAALEAGKVLEKYFETEILKETKEDDTIVTLADKESEEVIKKIITDNFPEHAILGEETGMTGEEKDFVWYVDPVDGTANFANGLPLFAISIALAHKGQIIIGVVYNPTTNNLFYAERGRGAYFNEKKISVSEDNQTRCIVTVAASKKIENKDLGRNLLHYLPPTIRSTREFGCTAIELAYVARGGIEANIQIGLNTYDFAAGTLLIEEAGGMITDHDGKPWKFPNNYFIASNGVFHDILVEEVQKQKAKLNL